MCPSAFTVSSPPRPVGEGEGSNLHQNLFSNLTFCLVYVNMGNVATDVVNLAFALPGTSTATAMRSWEIKVSQIECNNLNR